MKDLRQDVSILISTSFNYVIIYSESFVPTLGFRIDRCFVYTGYFSKDFYII